MAWAIITMYTSKCAQMDPQQPPKTSFFYSRCKKCDIKRSAYVNYHKTWHYRPCQTLSTQQSLFLATNAKL